MPFSAKWFFIYYLSLALLFMVGGGYLIFRKDKATNWLLKSANDENPPVLLIRTFKYVTLFTLPGLVISFFPFSWVELVFCLWGLLLLYIGATQLVRWKQSRKLIKQSRKNLPMLIKRNGAIMLSLSFAILLLAYLVIERAA